MFYRFATLLFALFFVTSFVFALEPIGEVTLPLDKYRSLIEQLESANDKAPVGYSLGSGAIRLSVEEQNEQMISFVNISLSAQVHESNWIAVSLLPAGTALEYVRVNGKEVQLFAAKGQLAWAVNKPGSYPIEIKYRVDARAYDSGYTLSFPIPYLPSSSLYATLPSGAEDAAVIPSSGFSLTKNASAQSIVQATLPLTSAVQLSWSVDGKAPYQISRAEYLGVANEDSIIWKGEYEIELRSGDSVSVALLARSITLHDIFVDGQPASISSEGDHFVIRLKGKGTHSIKTRFEVPIIDSNGPPAVNFAIPNVPISRIELRLDGDKELRVSPKARVTHVKDKDSTTATAYLSMTDAVQITWTEGVPVDTIEERRSSAMVYHTMYAEEGVLFVKAAIELDITRGESSKVELGIPADVQVNHVRSLSGAIADWRIAKDDSDQQRLTIFLNRKVKGEIDFEIVYDRSIVEEGIRARMAIPIVDVLNTQRQRGMIALLTSKEFELYPLEHERAIPVGENQLPAKIRDNVDKTIAHTFKYVESGPKLIANARTPERAQGKFDARIQTLVSLNDVTMTAISTVLVNVKSGTLEELLFKLPNDVNLLNVTAPSLRTHKTTEGDDQQSIALEFTQELTGRFKVELRFERILTGIGSDVDIPSLKVEGAEVAHGQLAIEALSAVEIQPGLVEGLSSIDPSELPKQLVLQTTNPILLAYTFVQSDPLYNVALKLTKHEEIDVETAAIDSALYRTLITRDGLAVTSARFQVRNSRRQFLRIALPTGSSIWSVFVGGKAEKPALIKGKGGAPDTFLVKVLNSTEGFPVHLTYQSPVGNLNTAGILNASLPSTDMIETHTRWELFVPDDVSFGYIDTTMEPIEEGTVVSRQAIESELNDLARKELGAASTPLRIRVPTAGKRYVFEKLYANQSGEGSQVRMGFVGPNTWGIAHALALFGIVLALFGAFSAIQKRSKGIAIASVCSGIFASALIVFISGISFIPATSILCIGTASIVIHQRAKSSGTADLHVGS